MATLIHGPPNSNEKLFNNFKFQKPIIIMSFIKVIRGVAILDSRTGNRLFSQYYSSATSDESSGLDTLAKQRSFEANFLSSIENLRNGNLPFTSIISIISHRK